MRVGAWVVGLDGGLFGIWLSWLRLGFEEGEYSCDDWVAHLEGMERCRRGTSDFTLVPKRTERYE